MRLGEAGDRFFFQDEPPLALGLYRLIYGLTLLAFCALIAGDLESWYGADSTVPYEVARAFTGPRLNLFAFLPDSAASAWGVLGLLAVSAGFLTIGLCSRWAAAAAFLALVSLHHRDPFLYHSGDTFLRVMGFWLIFAPADGAFSVGRLFAWRKLQPDPAPSWTRRMLQLQFSAAYLATALWKLQGPLWREGTAVHYALSLTEFQRFPLPAFLHQAWAIKALTWGTLGVEFSLGALIWVPALRPFVLIAGLLFHLGLEYSMNIPLFQWTMLGAFVLFLPPEAIERAAAFARGLVLKIRLPTGPTLLVPDLRRQKD
jgi:hypothetical protein